MAPRTVKRAMGVGFTLGWSEAKEHAPEGWRTERRERGHAEVRWMTVGNACGSGACAHHSRLCHRGLCSQQQIAKGLWSHLLSHPVLSNGSSQQVGQLDSANSRTPMCEAPIRPCTKLRDLGSVASTLGWPVGTTKPGRRVQS